VQRRLNGLGFDTKVTGKFDEQTRAVINRWQAARGYPKSGYLNKLQHKALLTEIVSATTSASSSDDSSDDRPARHHSGGGGGGGGGRHYRGGGTATANSAPCFAVLRSISQAAELACPSTLQSNARAQSLKLCQRTSGKSRCNAAMSTS
jgi:peptidoglycan hydrolase-like protein with peptidoglycan-binding domain